MSRPVPTVIKLYHIVHLDRLSSIIQDGFIWSDAEVQQRCSSGTTIGMSSIKERRMHKTLTCYPDLHVGECVPFYFCPRSVMLYLFYMNNHPDVAYTGGQEPIIHFVVDLQNVVEWAYQNGKRWVFTDSNAGSYYFNDYNNLDQLHRIDWPSVQATNWQNCREQKQAEFLMENQLPFELIESIGVYSINQQQSVAGFLSASEYKPPVNIMKNWYY